MSVNGGVNFTFWPNPRTPGSPDDEVAGTFDGTGAFVVVGDTGIRRFKASTSNFDSKSGNLQTVQFYTLALDPNDPQHPTDPQAAYGLAQDYGPGGVLKYTGSLSWNGNGTSFTTPGEIGKPTHLRLVGDAVGMRRGRKDEHARVTGVGTRTEPACGGAATPDPGRPLRGRGAGRQVRGYSPKNGNSRASSFLFGRRPYSQISNASACCTFAARSLPYQSASAPRYLCAQPWLRPA
jgi:hypothetical protein